MGVARRLNQREQVTADDEPGMEAYEDLTAFDPNPSTNELDVLDTESSSDLASGAGGVALTGAAGHVSKQEGIDSSNETDFTAIETVDRPDANLGGHDDSSKKTDIVGDPLFPGSSSDSSLPARFEKAIDVDALDTAAMEVHHKDSGAPALALASREVTVREAPKIDIFALPPAPHTVVQSDTEWEATEAKRFAAEAEAARAAAAAKREQLDRAPLELFEQWNSIRDKAVKKIVPFRPTDLKAEKLLTVARSLKGRAIALADRDSSILEVDELKEYFADEEREKSAGRDLVRRIVRDDQPGFGPHIVEAVKSRIDHEITFVDDPDFVPTRKNRNNPIPKIAVDPLDSLDNERALSAINEAIALAGRRASAQAHLDVFTNITADAKSWEIKHIHPEHPDLRPMVWDFREAMKSIGAGPHQVFEKNDGAKLGFYVPLDAKEGEKDPVDLMLDRVGGKASTLIQNVDEFGLGTIFALLPGQGAEVVEEHGDGGYIIAAKDPFVPGNRREEQDLTEILEEFEFNPVLEEEKGEDVIQFDVEAWHLTSRSMAWISPIIQADGTPFIDPRNQLRESHQTVQDDYNLRAEFAGDVKTKMDLKGGQGREILEKVATYTPRQLREQRDELLSLISNFEGTVPALEAPSSEPKAPELLAATEQPARTDLPGFTPENTGDKPVVDVVGDEDIEILGVDTAPGDDSVDPAEETQDSEMVVDSGHPHTEAEFTPELPDRLVGRQTVSRPGPGIVGAVARGTSERRRTEVVRQTQIQTAAPIALNDEDARPEDDMEIFNGR